MANIVFIATSLDGYMQFLPLIT